MLLCHGRLLRLGTQPPALLCFVSCIVLHLPAQPPSNPSDKIVQKTHHLSICLLRPRNSTLNFHRPPLLSSCLKFVPSSAPPTRSCPRLTRRSISPSQARPAPSLAPVRPTCPHLAIHCDLLLRNIVLLVEAGQAVPSTVAAPKRPTGKHREESTSSGNAVQKHPS